MEKKTWVMLENNPEVMNRLASKLGLSSELAFYDVWSLDEPELLAHIPRPVFALLVIIPHTPAWERDRQADAAEKDGYQGVGPDEPVIWFKQTIGNACGSIGFLHCAINGPAADYIQPGSDLDKIRRDAIPLKTKERADMLYNSLPFEEAHKSCVPFGDTVPTNGRHSGQHFVAFVKAHGRLWELEGSRKSPLDRGPLAGDKDVLSPEALDLGFRRVIKLEQESGGQDPRFSCIALARKA
ncbi:ubiquitin carboxyl-terminal hydrolase [Biscogniauxia mediterranea]|nr:ubiquitin carboxyl-terminal hydrolase [Biscogniauxia mediterranea]